MAKLVLFDSDQAKEEIYTVVLDMPPYNGDVEIDVHPKTRDLVVEARDRAKRNPIYNRHHVIRDGKRVAVEGRPDEALTRELIDAIVADWRGIVDKDGNPIPCTRETKIFLFSQHMEMANYVIMKSGEVAVFSAEADEGNSES